MKLLTIVATIFVVPIFVQALVIQPHPSVPSSQGDLPQVNSHLPESVPSSQGVWDLPQVTSITSDTLRWEPLAMIWNRSLNPKDAFGPKDNTLVWLVGDSIDQNFVRFACQDTPGGLYVTNHLLHCSFDGLTIVMAFHPGATAPPYFDRWPDAVDEETPHIITSRAQRIQSHFGKLPDATIVHSSCWDVANWWHKAGEPHQYDVPHQEISRWCGATIPKFLKLVQDTVPDSRIAFRSMPPLAWHDSPTDIGSYWYTTTNAPAIVTEMHKCMLTHTAANSATIYDKYTFLDLHDIVQSTANSWKGPLRQWYLDDVHPGPQLMSAYIKVALRWARGV